MENIKYIIVVVLFSIFLALGSASASQTDLIQPAAPAEAVTYNEDLTVGGTGRFDSIYIGKQGVGGVTFFNGTIVNSTTNDGADNPVTFGDGVRIDGMIWRGPSKGAGDGQALKIADDMNPALSAANNLGSSEFLWNNAFFSGDVQVGNIAGSGVIHPNNLSSSNSPLSGQVLSYDGNNFQWINNGGGSGSGDITAVNAGSGLSGGGNNGRCYFRCE